MNKYDALPSSLPDRDPDETNEWIESLESVYNVDGEQRARFLLDAVWRKARERSPTLPTVLSTDYVNTIPHQIEPTYPGDLELERRIRNIIRWNMVAMVTRANKNFDLGGHMSTYASSASLYEVGFNHFFRGRDAEGGGDQVYIQGHASPGPYARSFLEGRLTEEQLDHFRRETAGKGVSSYPHPWLMPDYWQFPTVSMGLGSLAAIYQARFARYLHNRGLKDTRNSRVWGFLGDGECDEPETLGAIRIATSEGLNNLTFVINCNLQRLDGPVRGNHKVIQELEGIFHGAGWNVIKVVWGSDWDPIFERDVDGALVKRVNEIVDGQFQRYTGESGAFIRQDLTQNDPRLLELLSTVSDEELRTMRHGGHDSAKIYAAYDMATKADKPTAILFKTIKGWMLGEGFEGSMGTHQMKKMLAPQLKALRDRLEIPVTDAELEHIPFYHPGASSPEVAYLKERRAALGGPLERRKGSVQLRTPAASLFEEFYQGSKEGQDPSTTIAFVRLLRKLLRDKDIGRYIVPIVPDEARSFGMESLFKEIGIYAHGGQKYEPHDAKMLLSYVERQNGQLLEEGITESGAMASFTAAGISYAIQDVPTIPFYLFYSMFGFQRTQDQIWAFGDARGRGFLMGGTAGRTTLNGEGLQHGDGHSHLQALAVPNCIAYDPAYAFETAVIVRDGLTRMLDKNEDVFYYITIYNENYAMPPMPAGVEDEIIRGLYEFKKADKTDTAKLTAEIFGSGPMMVSALEAQSILAEHYGVAANVWSATSYQQLYRDARRAERMSRMAPDKKPTVPFVTSQLAGRSGPVVMTSDWVAELPSLLARFIPNRIVPLGTNGFGRSDTREALRRFFEVDAAHVVIATLHGLMLEGKVTAKTVKDAMKRFEIDPATVDPANA